MKTVYCVCLLVMVASSVEAYGSDCGTDNNVFATLNAPLIIHSTADAKALTPTKETELTNKLHDYVESRMLALLSIPSKDPAAELTGYIRCLQGSVPEYSNWKDQTNTPWGWNLSPGRAVAVAYWIYRGGAGVPDLRPYFEVFEQTRDAEWVNVGEGGSTFVASTFFIKPIESPKTGEEWFLLFGNLIGDTGTRLRLEVVSFNGERLRTRWQRSGMRTTYVSKVDARQIFLKGTRIGAKGKAEDFEEILKVAGGGLEESGTKTMRPGGPS